MFLKISEAYKRLTDPESFRDEDDEDGDGFDMTEEDVMEMFMEMFMGGGGGVDMEYLFAMGDEDYEEGDEDDGELGLPINYTHTCLFSRLFGSRLANCIHV